MYGWTLSPAWRMAAQRGVECADSDGSNWETAWGEARLDRSIVH